MKKSIKIMGIAAMVLLLAVSCKKENKNGFNGETKFMTFSAGISQGDGKTYLDGLNLLWSDGDQIKINNNDPFTLTNGAGSSKGEFEGEAEVAETYYAVYPASSTLNDGTATITLPAEQPYVAGSFDKNVAPMVAMTDDSKAFTFTNVCGLLRLNMTSIAQPFKKIVLQSAKADESLAGDGSVTISGDESDKFVITNGTGNKITVTSDEDIASGAKIVFVLPAGTLTTGFNAYFYANANDVTPFDNISGSGDWEIEAGKMNDVTVTHEVKVQNAIIQQDAVTASSLTIPYSIQEACESASIQCADDEEFTINVRTKSIEIGSKAFKEGSVTFTGLSAATPYYVRILVKSVGDPVEKPYCTIVAETLGDGPTPTTPKFSVSATNFVEFALGNLWYGIAEGKSEPAFHFEENQWDYKLGDCAGGTAYYRDPNHMSYFFWSKDATVAVAESYEEPSASITDVFFTNDPTDEGKPNPNFTVNDASGTWRTLTRAEWDYLLGYDPTSHQQTVTCGRTNAMELCKWSEVTFDGNKVVKGLIIMPDGWSSTTITLSNTTDNATWHSLESDGAVFIPAAGYYGGYWVGSIQDVGDYWSSTPYTYNSFAYCIGVNSSNVNSYSQGRNYGYSVRLVRDLR